MKIPIHVTHSVQSDIYVKTITGHDIERHTRHYALGNHAVIITNPTILGFYAPLLKKLFRKIEHSIITVPDAEKAKSFATLRSIIDQLALKTGSVKRKVFIVCFGGGVVGDVGGFAASVYRRGIPYMQIPTTLLAQIDSSVGGKVAVNIDAGKNLVGQFYHPACILVDPVFLRTLPRAQIQDGLSEAVKYGVIADAELFHRIAIDPDGALSVDRDLYREIIGCCLKIKSRVVSKDEREKGALRTILNFGHTIGHALEGYFSYKRLSHGRAVSLGMVAATHISRERGLCPASVLNSIESVLGSLGLPTRWVFPEAGAFDRVEEFLFQDKKFTRGSIRMVLVEKIGRVRVVDRIPRNMIMKALRYIKKD